MAVITPHIAGPTPHYMKRLMEIFVKNLEGYMQGNMTEMVNVIYYSKGYWGRGLPVPPAGRGVTMGLIQDQLKK